VPRLGDLENLLGAIPDLLERPGPAGFKRRCAALDRLELHLAELSGIDPASSTARAAALRHQAIGLLHQLRDRNLRVAEALRHEIATGKRVGAELGKKLQRYCAEAPPTHATDNLPYDSLDALVADVLGVGALRDDNAAETLPEMIPYQPTPARIVLELVKRTNLGPGDIFVDIGSGLGIVSILVSLLSAAPAIGIEIDPSYCQYAKARARHVKASHVSFICQDARRADLSIGTVFYMYTPFRGAMLEQVLERLHAEGCRRTIRLVTYGPILSAAVQQRRFSGFQRSPLVSGSITIFQTRSK
jgi:Histone methylation protein DOT1